MSITLTNGENQERIQIIIDADKTVSDLKQEIKKQCDR
jgi:hypothetical protein